MRIIFSRRHHFGPFISSLFLAATLLGGLSSAVFGADELWRRVDTDLGPIFFLDTPAFHLGEGAKSQQPKGQGGRISFDNPQTATASTEFTLPETGRMAVVLLHDGMGQTRFTVNTYSFDLPALADAQKGAEPLYITTYPFMETLNEMAIVASKGTMTGVAISRPLVRLRDLSIHRAVLEVQRRMLLWVLRGEMRASFASSKPAPEGLAREIENLDGQAQRDFEAWDQGYLALYNTYRSIELGGAPRNMAGDYNRLLSILSRIEPTFNWSRSQYAGGEVLNPAAFRMAAGMPDPDTFRHYNWAVMRVPFLGISKDFLDRFRLLGIDAFSLASDTWPDPRMAEVLKGEQFWCVLETPVRTADRSENADLVARPADGYQISLETFMRDLAEQYADIDTVLAFTRDSGTALKEVESMNAFRGTAWLEYRRQRGQAPSLTDPTGLTSLADRLAYRAFLEDRLTKEFRDFNLVLARIVPNKPRIGLFAPPPPGPTDPLASEGWNAFGQMLDTGFPAVGMATGGKTENLLWAASLMASDPHLRPWWETDFPLSDGDKDMPLDHRLRTHLWRAMHWGLLNVRIDAGPLSEQIYNGPPEGGLLRAEVQELAVLKRAFLSLSRAYRRSRLVTDPVGLLESGLPERSQETLETARSWQAWALGERIGALWTPRELLTRDSGAALFAKFKVLMAPGPLALSESNGKALRDWVAEGGIFITTNAAGHFTADGRIVQWVQELIGAPLESPGPGIYQIAAGTPPRKGVEILRKDEAGRPIIVLAPLEKGYVLIGLGSVVRSDVWNAVMNRLAQFALPMCNLRTTTPVQQLELVLREDPDGARFLAALNPDREQAVRGQVELLGEYTEIRDVAGHRPLAVAATHGNGVTSLAVNLAPGESALYELGTNRSKLTPAETRAALEKARAPKQP